MPGFIARAEIDVNASADKVWQVITTHASDVTFGSTVESEWTPGSAITWRGECKQFEDSGEILEAVAPYRLVLTHFSPLSGAEDTPENRHRLVYELSGRGDQTHVEFSQDGNKTEPAATEAEQNWRRHLEAVKERAER